MEAVKIEKLEQIRNNQAVTYYGKLRGKIICEATALFDENVIQNSDGLVDDKTVYLCNFHTAKKHQDKGYFSKLFRFMLDDLKVRGYERFTLGVEPCETRNFEIYRHLGFNEYVKSAKETYTDATVVDVDYYLKEI